MKISEFETNDIKSMITIMEEQIANSKGNVKEFLTDYYKDFLETGKAELLKRGAKNDK